VFEAIKFLYLDYPYLAQGTKTSVKRVEQKVVKQITSNKMSKGGLSI
jgi:hypothetical protein